MPIFSFAKSVVLAGFAIFVDKLFAVAGKILVNYAILCIIDKIQKAIDDRSYSCGIFLDFTKAFDTVNHQILIKKLKYYGIRGIAKEWFISYLSDRQQIVTVNDATSTKGWFPYDRRSQ